MADTIPPFVTREKRKQLALVSLVVLSSAIIAFAPRNERRLFTVPDEPRAFMVMEAPVETNLRSPIWGRVFSKGSSFGERRPRRPGALRPRGVAPQPETAALPSAFFAEPVPDELTVEDLGQPFDIVVDPIVTDLPDFEPFVPRQPPGPGGPLGFVKLPVTVSGVPEPTSWALMIAGFAMVGHMLRRRSKSLLSIMFG